MKQRGDTMKRIKMNRKAFPALVGILSACLASTAYAQIPLIGSGNNLPLPLFGEPPNDPREIISETLNVEFEGQWPGTGQLPALSDWWGTFPATGPVPAGNLRDPGLTTYDDFTGLNAGFLPEDTMFRFGDVDGGSGNDETFTLKAWDLAGIQITDPWLNEPSGVWGSGRNPINARPTLDDMPGWEFNATTGAYFIDGRTVRDFNPNVAFMLPTNTDIGSLEVVRNSNFAGFSLAAPVPEPSSLALLSLGGLALLRRLR